MEAYRLLAPSCSVITTLAGGRLQMDVVKISNGIGRARWWIAAQELRSDGSTFKAVILSQRFDSEEAARRAWTEGFSLVNPITADAIQLMLELRNASQIDLVT